MLPSRIEPNIRRNCSAELRHSPNFGPSLLRISGVVEARHFKLQLQKSKCALTRWVAVLNVADQCFSACDAVCAKLALQILKVGRFSIGWFMLAARLVRAHLDFCTSRGQTQWFLLFYRHDLYVALTLCYKLITFLHWFLPFFKFINYLTAINLSCLRKKLVAVTEKVQC